MKIALIRRRFSATGGAENYLERLASGLIKRGHSVTLVCEQWTPVQSVITNIQAVASNSPREFSNAIQVLELKKSHDVVFSLERVVGCDVYRAGDGVHADWLEQREKYSPLLGKARNWINSKNRELTDLEREVFNTENTEHVIVNSNMVGRSIKKRFSYPSDHIHLVYNGVDLSLFSNGDRKKTRAAFNIPEDVFVVLFVGAGAERKGLSYARLATAALDDWPLWVIDSPQKVPMADIYAAADAFFLPTLYDPFANVTLEAMAAGLPVITTIHNGASEIITHEKEGFILQNADDFHRNASFLRLLQEDDGLRQRMGSAARKLAAQYTLDRNVTQTLEICELAAKR